MTAIQPWVINLNRNPERLESIASQFKALDVPFHRLNAVDSKAFTDDEFNALCAARPRNGKAWGRGQMGCFLSHYALWEQAANSPGPYTAIFEDDIHLSPATADFLKDDGWIPQGCDIVRFETSTNRLLLSKKPLAQHAGRQIYQVLSTSWCAGGYILSRDCARRLISVPPIRHNTSDHFLFCFENPVIADQLKIAQVMPALCVQDKMMNLDANKTVFQSEIVTNHEGQTIQARIKYLFKRSPLTYLRKTLQGYKKIPFAA